MLGPQGQPRRNIRDASTVAEVYGGSVSVESSTMAERNLETPPPEAWKGLSAPRLASIVAERPVVLALGFVIAAFLTYALLSPPATIFNNFVLLGHAFLDGRIDIANGSDLTYIEFAIQDGKYYIIPPPWPAIVLLPGVLVYGTDLNQTLAGTVIGGLTVGVVFLVVRSMTPRIATQVWATALFAFGTVFFYAAADGSVWFFSHNVAVFFLVAAIFLTITKPNPLLAGLCLGAAFWSRQPTILTFPFFLIMFSDQWFEPPEGEGGRFIDRIRLKPLLQLGTGVGVFLLASFIYNYERFGTPLDASQHHLPESVLAQPWFNHGPFDPRYVSRHVVVFFESMPIVQSSAPYVLPSWGGMALWAATPAFFYALFNRVPDKRWINYAVVVILVTTGIIISRALASLWDWGWATYEFPLHINILPFYLLIAAAIYFGLRDKFVIACWSAILPTALMLFTFAGTGFAQFGYRFSLDFMPFLFLLTVRAMGDDLKWHHKLLIAISIGVNLWGVVWIHQFQQHHFLDLEWVRF
jgi:hypothetical protein